MSAVQPLGQDDVAAVGVALDDDRERAGRGRDRGVPGEGGDGHQALLGRAGAGVGGGSGGWGVWRAGEERGHGERPQVQHGVGPPRAPAGGGVGVGAAEGGERLPQGEVAGQPDVGVGQAAQPDERRRPRPDAGDGEQRAPGLLAVGAGVEGDRSAGEGRGQRVHGAAARAGQPDGGEVGVGQCLRAREGVGEGADRLGQGSARRGDHACGQRARAGHGHLLAEHRPDRQLRGVRRRRDAAAGCGGDERRERRVRAQDVVHGGRVGVEVEHPAAPGDGGTEVAELGQPQARGDARAALGSGGELHDGGAVRQVEDAGERRPVPLLEAGHRVRAEEQQHLGRLVRRARGQPEGEPAGRAAVAPRDRSAAARSASSRRPRGRCR